MNPLVFAAKHGRWVLVSGLVVGVLLPSVAQVLRPLIPEMVVCLLFLAALRLRPADILETISALPRIAGTVLTLQLLLPFLVLGAMSVAQAPVSPLVIALVLMTAAPSIASSPNLVLMFGHPPVHALRIMVAGTAILPLTVVPIFWAMPQLGSSSDIATAATKLFAVILVTTTVALLIRHFFAREPSRKTFQQLDGLSAITLAVFVVGLMPAVATAFLNSPTEALFWVAVVFVANVGLQLVSFRFLKNRAEPSVAVSTSLIAGNRNIALFLVALPEHVTAPIMVFIGCYQIPMYLTPILMEKLYRNKAGQI